MMQLPDPITLPVSGKVASFRRLKGRDLVTAEMVQTAKGSDKEYNMALLAARVLLDGQQAILENMLDMDEEDLEAIMDALAGNAPSGSHPTG